VQTKVACDDLIKRVSHLDGFGHPRNRKNTVGAANFVKKAQCTLIIYFFVNLFIRNENSYKQQIYDLIIKPLEMAR